MLGFAPFLVKIKMPSECFKLWLQKGILFSLFKCFLVRGVTGINSGGGGGGVLVLRESCQGLL